MYAEELVQNVKCLNVTANNRILKKSPYVT